MKRWEESFHLCDGKKGTWVIEVVLHSLERWQNPEIAKLLEFFHTDTGNACALGDDDFARLLPTRAQIPDRVPSSPTRS